MDFSGFVKGLKLMILLASVLFSLLSVPLLSRWCFFLSLPWLSLLADPSKDSVSYR